MAPVNLPLNNNSSAQFTSNYVTYVNVYELDKVSFVDGFVFVLNDLNGIGIKGIFNSPNTIQFSPCVPNVPPPQYFYYVNGKYVPNKWLESNLYQEKNTDMNNNFTFKGNMNTNTLHTSYGDNYNVKVFIKALDSNYQPIVTTIVPIISGNFNLTLDTTNVSNIYILQWGFEMDGYPVYVLEANNQGSINITDMTNVIACFKSDSKILTDKGYIPIQDLRKGDLVKTLLHDYMPIVMIGKRDIYHPASKERIKDQLYKCSQKEYPEVFEPLIITGCHSILVDGFTSEEQKEKTLEVNGDIFGTDNKYRLPACVDEKTSVYEIPGSYTIYHVALENENYYSNYGIYANGLLVETCSKRYLKELSNMTLID